MTKEESEEGVSGDVVLKHNVNPYLTIVPPAFPGCDEDGGVWGAEGAVDEGMALQDCASVKRIIVNPQLAHYCPSRVAGVG